jgi:hypothetical protein
VETPEAGRDPAIIQGITRKFIGLAEKFLESDGDPDQSGAVRAIFGDEADPVELYEGLYFGFLPLYQRDERLLGISPRPDREFGQWPVAEYDVEMGFSLQAIHDTKGLDLAAFADGSDAALYGSGDRGWALFTQPWPGFPAEPLQAAQAAIDSQAHQDSTLWPFLEAIAAGSEDTMYNLLINAGEALEETGELMSALVCYYNVLVGNRLERNWNQTCLEGLLRCADACASASFRTYLGLVLRLRKA